MLKNTCRKIGKGIKKFVNEKVKTCKEILSNDKSRKVMGVILIGVGVGLFASGYIH